MEKIDCFGDYCPIPLLKAKNELQHIQSGESFMLVTDHSCVVESLKDYFGKSDCTYFCDEVINGVWEITVTKP